MRQKQKNRKVAALLACMALALIQVAGGALAKYTSRATGSNQIDVAKWQFEVNGTNVTTSADDSTFTVNLFGAVKDSNGGAEEHVQAGKIAPGTSGSFDIKIANKSEVTGTYDLTFSVENTSSIPLQFSKNKSDWKTTIGDLNVTDKELIKETGTDTVTLYWKWDFEGTNVAAADKADTALGIAAQTSAPLVRITCSTNFEQVD